jgi:hypothetical protein
MKIIQEGKIPTFIKTFKCRYCGCVFEAEKNEYKVEHSQYSEVEYIAECPCCKEKVYGALKVRGEE